MGGLYPSGADGLTIVVEGDVAALGEAAAVVGKLHPHLVLALGNGRGCFDRELVNAQHVVGEFELAVLGVDAPATKLAALGDDHAAGGFVLHFNFRRNRKGLVLDVDDAVFRQSAHACKENLRIALHQGRTARHLWNDALGLAIIQGQHVVLHGFDQEEALKFAKFVGHFRRQVVELRPVFAAVVEFPHVVVKGGHLLTHHHPGGAVLGDGAPALVVDAPVAKHLEVLDFVAFWRVGIVKAVGHAGALVGALQHAVHHGGFRDSGHLQHRGGHVNHMAKLVPQAAFFLNRLGIADDGAVAGAAPVGSHLLRPLVGGIHRPGPAHGVVVVGIWPAKVLQLGLHEFRRF